MIIAWARANPEIEMLKLLVLALPLILSACGVPFVPLI